MSVRELVALARASDLIAREDQEELTARLVLPAMPELIALVTAARKEIDGRFRQLAASIGDLEPSDVRGDSNLAVYPVGFCRTICEQVFEALSHTALVQRLCSHGLVFKTVYIMLYGRYFQNAIQIGNLYLDAANDTVDPRKPFLEWMPIRELDYRNLESWDEVISIVESYYHCRVIPNRSFPLLSLFLPFFVVRSNGRIEFLIFQDQFFLKDLDEGMRRYTDWITGDRGVAARVLCAQDEALLEREFGANDFANFPFEYAVSTPAGLVAQARELVHAADQQNGKAVIRKLIELAQQATRIFRERNLISASHAASPELQ
jgi:hypothetical protein